MAHKMLELYAGKQFNVKKKKNINYLANLAILVQRGLFRALITNWMETLIQKQTDIRYCKAHGQRCR